MDAIEAALRGDPVDLDRETRPELAALRGCPQTEVFHAEGPPTSWSSTSGRTTSV
jgi:hypothetical protein